jgi:glycogen synthase
MTTVTAKEILVQARELISDENHWTVKGLARNKDHAFVAPSSNQATCWCAMGAICKVDTMPGWDFENLSSVALRASWHLDEVAERYCFASITNVNDHRGHAAVLAVFDEAIKTITE